MPMVKLHISSVRFVSGHRVVTGWLEHEALRPVLGEHPKTKKVRWVPFRHSDQYEKAWLPARLKAAPGWAKLPVEAKEMLGVSIAKALGKCKLPRVNRKVHLVLVKRTYEIKGESAVRVDS